MGTTRKEQPDVSAANLLVDGVSTSSDADPAVPTLRPRDENVRLLLVEDDAIDQLAFKRFVASKRLSYDYAIASSVGEARRACESSSFDVVVSDYLLGDGTAFDVLRAAAGVPLIVITGAGDEHVAVAALRVGVADYLVKDVRRSDLERLPVSVERAVRSAQAESLLGALVQALTLDVDGLVITDSSERVMFANSAVLKRLREPGAAIGRTIEELLSELPSGIAARYSLSGARGSSVVHVFRELASIAESQKSR